MVSAAPRLEDPRAADPDQIDAWTAQRQRPTHDVGADGGWREDAEALASQLGLGTVRVRSDYTARRIADAEGARGVALGDTVYLHPDRLQPGTAEGREVLAHELVHLAQARLPAEHDIGREAAEHEAAEIARSIAAGGSVTAPRRSIDLARPAADRHAVEAPKSAIERQADSVDRLETAYTTAESAGSDILTRLVPGYLKARDDLDAGQVAELGGQLLGQLAVVHGARLALTTLLKSTRHKSVAGGDAGEDLRLASTQDSVEARMPTLDAMIPTVDLACASALGF